MEGEENVGRRTQLNSTLCIDSKTCALDPIGTAGGRPTGSFRLPYRGHTDGDMLGGPTRRVL